MKEPTELLINIYLHYSTNTEYINQELFELGDKVRNIVNAQQWNTFYKQT